MQLLFEQKEMIAYAVIIESFVVIRENLHDK